MNLIDFFPGFILGWSAAFLLMLCRDAGDFDRLATWWPAFVERLALWLDFGCGMIRIWWWWTLPAWFANWRERVKAAFSTWYEPGRWD